jgi:arginase family enzyme
LTNKKKMSFFAFPLEEDKINGVIQKNKVFHLIEMPLSLYSTKEFQSTHLAPKKIKEASFEIYGSNFGEIREKCIKEQEQDFFNDLTVKIDKEKREKMVKKLESFLKDISEKNKENIFVFLGGNHLISYFTIKALKPDLVIHFDAHADLDPLEKDLKHSNFIRFLIKELKKLKIVQIGLSNTTKEEFEFINKNKEQIEAFKSIEFWKDKTNVLKKTINEIKKAKEKKGKEPKIYLTIDTDVFEGNFASYQGEALGIRVIDFLFFIEELNKVIKQKKLGKITGFDLVELNPHLDLNNYWTTAIARVLIELISLL